MYLWKRWYFKFSVSYINVDNMLRGYARGSKALLSSTMLIGIIILVLVIAAAATYVLFFNQASQNKGLAINQSNTASPLPSTTTAYSSTTTATTTAYGTSNSTASTTTIQSVLVSGSDIFPSGANYSLNQNSSAKYGWNTGEYVYREIQPAQPTIVMGNYTTTNPPYTAPGEAGAAFVGILTPAQFSNFTAGKDTIYEGYPYLQGPGGAQACVYCGYGKNLLTAVMPGTYYMVLANINYVGQYSGQYTATITKSYTLTPSSDMKVLFPVGSSYTKSYFSSEVTLQQNYTIIGAFYRGGSAFGEGDFMVYTPAQYANYSSGNYTNYSYTDEIAANTSDATYLNVTLPAGKYYFGFFLAQGSNVYVPTAIVAVPTSMIR